MNFNKNRVSGVFGNIVPMRARWRRIVVRGEFQSSKVAILHILLITSLEVLPKSNATSFRNVLDFVTKWQHLEL